MTGRAETCCLPLFCQHSVTEGRKGRAVRLGLLWLMEGLLVVGVRLPYSRLSLPSVETGVQERVEEEGGRRGVEVGRRATESATKGLARTRASSRVWQGSEVDRCCMWEAL